MAPPINPCTPGKYTIQMREKVGDEYPYLGSTVIITWMPADGKGEESGSFVFTKTLSGPEPRGLCVLAKQDPQASKGGQDPHTHLRESIVVRLPDIKGLEAPAIEKYIRSFGLELNAELDILKKLDAVQDIAHRLRDEDCVPEADLGVNGDHAWPALLREYLPGQSLKQWCAARAVGKEYAGCSLSEWFPLAKEIISLVHRVHLAGATHGYICPENIIVDVSNGLPAHPRLVNFEREVPDPTLHLTTEDPIRIDPNLSWRRSYDSPEKVYYLRSDPGIREFYDPYVPGDLFSLGLTLLYLAAGCLVEPFLVEEDWGSRPWRRIKYHTLKSNLRIKNEVYSNFQRAAQIAGHFNYEDMLAATEIVCACLRFSGHRFYNARSILEVFNRYHPETETENGRQQSLAGAINGLFANLCDIHEFADSLVLDLYQDRLRRTLAPLTDSEPVFRYTVGPSREDIVDALVTMFLKVQPRGGTESSKCQALTTPAFFFDENCGPVGRVISALKIAVSRGTRIQWLFVLNEACMNDPDVVRVLDHQKETFTEMRKLKPDTLEIGWVAMSPLPYKLFLRSKPTFLYFSAGDLSKRRAVILPDYASEGGRIIALRVFPETDRKRFGLISEFDKYWLKRTEIWRYPHATLRVPFGARHDTN